MKHLGRVFLVAAIVGSLSLRATAIPVLQLYIEGATYDESTETWWIGHSPFTLLVIGNVEQFGTIYDVRLAAAVPSNEAGTITLAPTTATVVSDPSVPPPPQPTANFPSQPGAIPLMPPDNRPLPRHEVYHSGVKFYEWKLGDFTLTDSPIGDFIYGVPTEFPKMGQINAYTVTVFGFALVWFDADGYIEQQGGQQGKQRSVFTPFSHNAAYSPEPTTVLLLLSGMAPLLWWRRRRLVRK